MLLFLFLLWLRFVNYQVFIIGKCHILFFIYVTSNFAASLNDSSDLPNYLRCLQKRIYILQLQTVTYINIQFVIKFGPKQPNTFEG